MQSTSNFKKVLIFCEYSKKIGGGHFARSKRLYNYLKNKYDCKLYININNLRFNKLIETKENKIIFYDYKSYKKFKTIHNKHNFFIFFDNNKKILKNSLNINPLTLNKKKYSGPNWFLYPREFTKNKRKIIIKKHVSIFIVQGLTDANNNLNKITKYFLTHPQFHTFKIYVKTPHKNYLEKNLKNYKNIYEVSKIPNMFNFLNKIHLAISSIGNTAFELAFLNIPTIFVSDEKIEIKRGKIFEKKKIGKFFYSKERRNILDEMNKILKNKNYKKQIINIQKQIFNKKTLNNYDKLIRKIVYEKNKL